MAKLKPIDFKFKAVAGDPLVFRSEASLLESTGMFSLTIPDELEEVARTIVQSHGTVYGVDVDRPKLHLRVTGTNLAGCKNFIEHVAKDYLQCDVSVETVIVYSIDNKVSYVKDDEGNFYENGQPCRKLYDRKQAKWHGKLSGTTSATHYQVGLVARGFTKTTHTRSSGKTVVYSRAAAPDGSWLARLNGFCGVGISERDVQRLAQRPYTEETAQFFFNTMMAMCKLADKIDTFFGDPVLLNHAIENQTGLLSAPK